MGLAACSSAREGMEGHNGAVARVEGHVLTIEDAAELVGFGVPLLETPEIAAVDAVVSFWVGYTLLASELASADTFSDVDVGPMIRLQYAQNMVWKLHADVIEADAEPSGAELRESYEREQPYTRVFAQHILIRVPDAATEAEADSLRRVADGIREQALVGADFSELARVHSEDLATYTRGGELGWVGPERLVPELEQTVLAMQPGMIGETVRSRLGYHIFKVTDRQAPEYEQMRDEYRSSYLQRRTGSLEQIYLDSLFDAGRVRYAPGAVSLVKRLAGSTGLERLSPAMRSAVLVRFKGGVLTVGEWADFVQRGAPTSRRLFAVSDSATLHGYLREMTRNKLLTRAAIDLGYSVSEAKFDSLRTDAIQELLGAASMSGFRRDEFLNGDVTVESSVHRVLQEVGRRQRRTHVIERVAPALRSGSSILVYPDRYPAVIAALAESRQGAAEMFEQPSSEEPGS
jgi:hypothetical protein